MTARTPLLRTGWSIVLLPLALAYAGEAPSAQAPTTGPSTAAVDVPAASAAAPAASTADSKSAVILPQTPRFNQVRARIKALFEHRNETPAPPNARTNPFRPLGPLAPATNGQRSKDDAAPASEPESDLAVLQRSAATLKISGIFEIGGTSHLVINARPYKQGDVVPTQVNGETVYLRVRIIARRAVTLALNEAEMTLKF